MIFNVVITPVNSVSAEKSICVHSIVPDTLVVIPCIPMFLNAVTKGTDKPVLVHNLDDSLLGILFASDFLCLLVVFVFFQTCMGNIEC